MILSGIDEAALGPRLGPFCAVRTQFVIDEAVSSTPELYPLLEHLVAPRKDSSGRLAVGDSKTLFSSGRGLGTLERGVSAFLAAADVALPTTLKTLIGRLCPEGDLKELLEMPWYADLERSIVPESEILPGFRRDLEDRGIAVRPPGIRLVSARAFNRLLEREQGKSGAVRAVVGGLLTDVLETPEHRVGRVTVDRQGGRRYYGPWMAALAPGAPLRAEEESQARSVYRMGETTVEFLVGADGFRMETALASMFAKYLRERLMAHFNSWWRQRLPGLKPTAGYPFDARRFLEDLDRAGLSYRPEDMVRRL